MLQGLKVLQVGSRGRQRLLLLLHRLAGESVAAAAASPVAAVRRLSRARPQVPELLVDGHDAV